MQGSIAIDQSPSVQYLLRIGARRIGGGGIVLAGRIINPPFPVQSEENQRGPQPFGQSEDDKAQETKSDQAGRIAKL